MSVPYVKTVSASTLPENIVILHGILFIYRYFLPSKSMTIGTLLDSFVDRSRTASFEGSAVVVIAAVVAIVVVEAAVGVKALHS